jgi:AbrB family looped-hinge helix DNA binding protein
LEVYRVETNFSTRLARNGQATIPKEIREKLKLLPGDFLFLGIRKVLSPEGDEKYNNEEVKDG